MVIHNVCHFCWFTSVYVVCLFASQIIHWHYILAYWFMKIHIVNFTVSAIQKFTVYSRGKGGKFHTLMTYCISTVNSIVLSHRSWWYWCCMSQHYLSILWCSCPYLKFGFHIHSKATHSVDSSVSYTSLFWGLGYKSYDFTRDRSIIWSTILWYHSFLFKEVYKRAIDEYMLRKFKTFKAG